MKKFGLYFLLPLAISVFGTLVSDWVKDLPILSTFASILNWLWNTVFCAKFSLWQIILFLLILFFVLLRISKVKNEKDSKPKFLDYTSDRIAGLHWSWRWILNSRQNAWVVDNLKPQCSTCETLMHYKYEGYGTYNARCPRCEQSYFDIKSHEDIEAIILDNCRKKI